MRGSSKHPVGIPAGDLRRQRRARLRKASQLRWRHRLRRLKRAAIAATLIFVASLVLGFFVDGIGIEGIIATFALMFLAFVPLALFPRTRSLSANENTPAMDLPGLADYTQLWLESRRGMLPDAARRQVDLLGSRLEVLSPKLAGVQAGSPEAREIRQLLEEHLPSLIESYAGIPDSLRQQPHAGSTPQAQLTEGLATVASEVESIGSMIAGADLDALAIRGRYLEARYRGAEKGDNSLT